MRYESKHQKINKPAEAVYSWMCDFTNFTPALASKVDNWQATADNCSFKAQGFDVALEMLERERPSLIKIGPGQGCAIPFPFTFFVQLKEVSPQDTRMRIVLDVELNMMIKMMIGSKLQDAIDKVAEQIATAFNSI